MQAIEKSQHGGDRMYPAAQQADDSSEYIDRIPRSEMTPAARLLLNPGDVIPSPATSSPVQDQDPSSSVVSEPSTSQSETRNLLARDLAHNAEPDNDFSESGELSDDVAPLLTHSAASRDHWKPVTSQHGNDTSNSKTDSLESFEAHEKDAIRRMYHQLQEDSIREHEIPVFTETVSPVVTQKTTRKLVQADDDVFTGDVTQKKPDVTPVALVSGRPRMRRTQSCTVGSLSQGKEARLPLRDTLTSRRRIQLAHAGPPPAEPEPYRTPLQRKQALIRDLRAQMTKLQSAISCSEQTTRARLATHAQTCAAQLESSATQHRVTVTKYRQLQEEHVLLQRSHQEALQALSNMAATVTDLKENLKHHKLESERMYLEMYRKGQECARFERQEEIERLSTEEARKVSPVELMQQLQLKERELGRWKNLRLQESYEEGTKASSNHHATLRFLRDALFHYITNPRDAQVHLRAMVRIFDYSDAEKKKLARSIIERQNKGKL